MNDACAVLYRVLFVVSQKVFGVACAHRLVISVSKTKPFRVSNTSCRYLLA